MQKLRLCYIVGPFSLFLFILPFVLNWILPYNSTLSTFYGMAVIVGIGGMLFAAGLGVSILIKKRKKLSQSQSEASPVSKEQKGRPCNVCGTTIPEGQNKCPNCGDTYSI